MPKVFFIVIWNQKIYYYEHQVTHQLQCISLVFLSSCSFEYFKKTKKILKKVQSLTISSSFPLSTRLQSPGDPSHIKIIDFGFSKNCERTQSFLGTHGYLAPEMMAHEKYTTAVDMWALGVCAYALLSGYLPFDEMEPPEPGYKFFFFLFSFLSFLFVWFLVVWFSSCAHVIVLVLVFLPLSLVFAPPPLLLLRSCLPQLWYWVDCRISRGTVVDYHRRCERFSTTFIRTRSKKKIHSWSSAATSSEFGCSSSLLPLPLLLSSSSSLLPLLSSLFCFSRPLSFLSFSSTFHLLP